MNKIIIILNIFFLILSIGKSSSEIKIKYKIDSEIITNIDIQNERNYLLFLRPELNKLKEAEIIKISENSIIKEIIKKKELNKIYKNIKNINFDKQILEKILNFKKIENVDKLKILMRKNNVNYDDVIDKLKYERLWNDLISRKYSKLLKINKKRLREDLILRMKNNKKFEYNLSELLFEVEKNERLNDKYKNIVEYIKINNFKTAASKYSIANSALRGGNIGWVKETLLSDSLINVLVKMKINELSKPLKYPNGYLVLRLNGKKEMKQVINIDKELSEIIKFETNRQLNQFSLLFYKKLKQNTVVDEQ